MTSNRTLKAETRSLLTGCLPFAMMTTFVYGVISVVLFSIGDMASVSPRQNAFGLILNLLISFLLFAAVTMLQTGYCFVALNISRTGHAKLRDLFLGFRYHSGRLVVLSLVLGAIRFLCALPFIYIFSEFEIHGTRAVLFGYRLTGTWQFVLTAIICAAVSIVLFIAVYLLYDQALFLFIDHQDYGVIQCLKESRKLMKKSRLQLLLLELSFIGYWLLVILSLGIAVILVKPYMEVAKAGFYVELSGQRNPYGE